MAPATGLSLGCFYYSVGIVFSVGAAALLLRNLWQAVTGKLTEKDLIQVRESEDEAEDGEAARQGGGPIRRRVRPTAEGLRGPP